MQYRAIACNAMQYNAIPCNTMQYHASLITADGAYHCPVGSIMAIFIYRIILWFCTLFYEHIPNHFIAIIITPFCDCRMSHHISLWTLALFLILFSVSTIYVVTVKERFLYNRFNTVMQPYEAIEHSQSFMNTTCHH